MTPAYFASLGNEQALQHARAGEGELQMQLVHAPHQCKIGGRHRTRLVVETTATDVQHGRLPCERKIMIAVNHRLALSNPALSSALSKKSFSSVSSPIFACSALMSTAWRRSSSQTLRWPLRGADPSTSISGWDGRQTARPAAPACGRP